MLCSLFGGFFVLFVFLVVLLVGSFFLLFFWFLGFRFFYSSSVAFPCKSTITGITALFTELNSLENNSETPERTAKGIKKK